MQDGFKLVKKRRNRKHKFENKYLNEYLDIETYLNEKVQKAVDEFESSYFCFDLLQGIDSCLKLHKEKTVNELLCYGIGNISESKSSLHQLAALLVFNKKYNCSIKLYDPILSSSEIKFLESLEFEVLTENEEGKRKLVSNLVTLTFFPHCPKQLTNNFLWANWNINLKNCILIGNSFSKIVESNTKQVLLKSAEYIFKIQPVTQEIQLEQSYHIENTFNDISIHHFQSSKVTDLFFLGNTGSEPVYSGQTELIPKTAVQ